MQFYLLVRGALCTHVQPTDPSIESGAWVEVMDSEDSALEEADNWEVVYGCEPFADIYKVSVENGKVTISLVGE